MARKLCTCSDVPFYQDCECQTGNLGVEDIFDEVMVRAREAELFYCCMVEKSQCEVDKEMFRQFSMDERRHYALLQQILRELTCECYCVGEVCIEEPKGFCKAIKVAIYNEMQLSNDYENLAYYLTEMCHREILLKMIQDSRCHAERLAELYKFAQECACKNVASESTENPCCCNPCCMPCNPCCMPGMPGMNGNGMNMDGCMCGYVPFLMPCCNNTGEEAEEEEEEEGVTYRCMDDDTCPCSCGHAPMKKHTCGSNPAKGCSSGTLAAETKGCKCRSIESGCWGCR